VVRKSDGKKPRALDGRPNHRSRCICSGKNLIPSPVATDLFLASPTLAHLPEFIYMGSGRCCLVHTHRYPVKYPHLDQEISQLDHTRARRFVWEM
jgi:hypothetical protein